MIIERFRKQAAETEIYEIDWAARYLEGVDDTAGNLLAFSYSNGITATPEVSVGQPVPDGVLRVTVVGGTSGRDYRITALMGTGDGREKEADIVIEVRG